LKDVISLFDIFGRPISLTFNNKGVIHQTFAGGMFSLLLIILIVVFTGLSGVKITDHLKLTTTSLEDALDPEILGNVNYNETGIVFITHLVSPYVDDSFTL
jgi:hypothetical protein